MLKVKVDDNIVMVPVQDYLFRWFIEEWVKMIKCDLCKQDISAKTLLTISWFGGSGISGELHFHKGCFVLSLQKLESVLKGIDEESTPFLTKEMFDSGTFELSYKK